MERIVFALLLVSLLVSCKNSGTDTSSINSQENTEAPGGGLLVAEGIIYDVIVKAEKDDPWLNEMVAGYNGKEYIKDLFEAIYAEEVKVTDYHTGNVLTTGDIKKLEARDEYSRDRIGKFQFTEDWYYFPATNRLDKRVRSVVPGYRIDEDELGRIGYLAAFKIDL